VTHRCLMFGHWLAFVISVVAKPPGALHAQSRAAMLITDARAQIEALNDDSAAVLLTEALRGEVRAAEAERVCGLVLMGIVHLSRRNEWGAREAFRVAQSVRRRVATVLHAGHCPCGFSDPNPHGRYYHIPTAFVCVQHRGDLLADPAPRSASGSVNMGRSPRSAEKGAAQPQR
jgi:hypothetical protein